MNVFAFKIALVICYFISFYLCTISLRLNFSASFPSLLTHSLVWEANAGRYQNVYFLVVRKRTPKAETEYRNTETTYPALLRVIVS